MAEITVTGATGYIGRALVARLLDRHDRVTVLTRPASRSKVPAGAAIVEGSALNADDVARALTPGCTLVLLVGTPHPTPAKAQQFLDVDLASVRAAAAAVARSSVRHIIYVSVASPAPVMASYIAARAEGERLLKQTRVPLTVMRPWYVIGPGRRWPLMLTPLYKVLERIPATRDTASRLGLVTHAQMVSALVAATTAALPAPMRVYDVPAIRAVKP